MGMPLCFTPVVYYLFFIIYYSLLFIFSNSIFDGKERRSRDLRQDVEMWCNFITQIGGGPYLYPCILRVENMQSLLHTWAMVRL